MTFVSDIVDGILASAAFIGSPSDPQVRCSARRTARFSYCMAEKFAVSSYKIFIFANLPEFAEFLLEFDQHFSGFSPNAIF